MYMSDNSKSLYNFGGTTAILSGLMMMFLGYWFIFQSDNYPEDMHGVGVVMTTMIVPTIVATTILLIKDVKNGAFLALAFATLWIITDLLAHSSQTAPLKKINELIAVSSTEDIETSVKWVWQDWSESLTLISAFLYSVSAICYGISIRKWGNSIGAFLFFLSAFVYVLTFIPIIDFNWHILFRGITFIFLGGVLYQAPTDIVEEVWES